jgi:MFS family permease
MERVASFSSRLEHSFRALRHRNFQLFVGGQFISLIGTWMQTVALGWLVYRLTHSPLLLGLTGFLGQIPSLVVSPLAGVLADRWNRHRMVIATQVFSMVQATVLAILVLTHRITIGEILGLSLFIGLINAVDVPVRQSFLVEMVAGGEDLANAIALNSSNFNVARLVGPAIAGVLIGLVGEGMVFLVNALSYLGVIGALLAIRVPPRSRPAQPPGMVWTNMKEGIRYVTGFAPIRSVLLLLALVSVFGSPYAVLMPVFARDVLHGDAHTLGFLVGAGGIGALAGALYLAARTTVKGLGRIIVGAATAFGAGLCTFAMARNQWIAAALLVVIGFGIMVHMAATNTIIQTLVDPDKRGRVMSFYTVSFMGIAPLGSLTLGAIASHIGAPWTVFLGGTVCIAGALLFARRLPELRRQVHPIYVRLGLVSGATELEAPISVAPPAEPFQE